MPDGDILKGTHATGSADQMYLATEEPVSEAAMSAIYPAEVLCAEAMHYGRAYGNTSGASLRCGCGSSDCWSSDCEQDGMYCASLRLPPSVLGGATAVPQQHGYYMHMADDAVAAWGQPDNNYSPDIYSNASTMPRSDDGSRKSYSRWLHFDCTSTALRLHFDCTACLCAG